MGGKGEGGEIGAQTYGKRDERVDERTRKPIMQTPYLSAIPYDSG